MGPALPPQTLAGFVCNSMWLWQHRSHPVVAFWGSLVASDFSLATASRRKRADDSVGATGRLCETRSEEGGNEWQADGGFTDVELGGAA